MKFLLAIILALAALACRAGALPIDYRCNGDPNLLPDLTQTDAWTHAVDGVLPRLAGRDPCWVRVDVSGLGSQVLSIRNEILSTHLTLKVQLTDQQQNVLAEGQGSGLRYNAIVNSNGMLFPTIAPALNSVLVRVQRQGFNGEVRSSVLVESVDLASATQSARNHDIFHFSVASAYLMVAIFFAVLTLALHDGIYLIFTAYLLVFAVSELFDPPVILTISSNLAPFWLHLIDATLIPAGTAFTTLAYVRLGKFDLHAPALNRLGWALAAAYLLSIFGWYQSTALGNTLQMLLGYPFWALIGTGLWRSWRQGHGPSAALMVTLVIDMVTWVPYTSMALVARLRGDDPLQFFPPEWIVSLGSFLVPMVFLYSIIERTVTQQREHRRERQRLRADALRLTEQNANAMATATYQRALAQAESERAKTLSEASVTLERLGDIGRELTAGLDQASVFAVLDRHLGTSEHQLLLTDSCKVYLTDTATHTLRLAHGLPPGQEPSTAALFLDASESLANCAAQHRQTFNESDAERSRLCAPMLIGDRLVGVVCIEAARPDAYGEREQSILEALCAYCAVALHNTGMVTALEAALSRAAPFDEPAATPAPRR